MPLSRLPFPSLLSLDLGQLLDTSMFQICLESFSTFSPNISSLQIHPQLPWTVNNFNPSWICEWHNLQSLTCRFPLGLDALAPLSRMPSLTRLDFGLSDTFLASDSIPSFFNLHDMSLNSRSLAPVQRLLSLIRLPVIADFVVLIDKTPSKEELTSFLNCVHTSGIGHTVRGLRLYQYIPMLSSRSREGPLLSLEDLRPCKTFSNLRCINFSVQWNIGLTDNDLLTLTSAWPQLEELYINEHWGWNTLGGITPNGLLRLLQTCRSLSHIALAIDTRNYTELPASPASLGLTLPSMFSIDVIDSIIKADAVPAITAFFSAFAFYSFRAWDLEMISEYRNAIYRKRWTDVFREHRPASFQDF